MILDKETAFKLIEKETDTKVNLNLTFIMDSEYKN